MTRNGKIARLPVEVREELNRKLENGEAGVRLIEWLNGLPEVVKVLAKEFEGAPITDMNLSLWKNGGFLDWQARRKAESVIERWGADSSKLKVKNSKLEDGVATSEEVAAAMTERLMVHYAAALEDAIAETGETAGDRVARLGKSLRDMVRVRRYDLERERCAAEQERVKMERERLELLRARLAKQAPGAEAEKKPGLSHEEKAEMVKQMLRDAKASVSEKP